MIPTNTNPKNDALAVLSILCVGCEDAQFNKDFVLAKINEIMNAPEPHHLLRGADYTRFMQMKDKTHYRTGD